MAAEIVPFPPAKGSAAPALSTVGGKGLSLWHMSSTANARVPGGFVLTTAFFARWFEQLKTQPSWKAMLDACAKYNPDDQSSIDALHQACGEAKAASERLSFDAKQLELLAAALKAATAQDPSAGVASFVAVRSSSPEEDLAGMSFAGGYETVLGVKADTSSIQTAVRRVFASCLDQRVFVYKLSNGIADLTPRIAVVVQRQIAAKVAGVAFSLDPISNCYDWATINTNWGLGETVVSGQCSPDYFLVDKVSGKQLKRELGKKQTSVWLGQDGGVHEKPGKCTEFTLSDANVAQIVKGLNALEKFYGHPIDTEFAFDDRDQLYWLQARPITTHTELHPRLVTKPGQHEVLWLDMMQIVQGFSQRASIAGISFIQMLANTLAHEAFSLKSKNATIHNRPFTVLPEAGSLYFNGSYILKLLGWKGKDSWADKLELFDFNVAKVIRELEDRSLPRSASILPLPALLLWNMPGLPANVKKNSSDLKEGTRRADDVHAGIWKLVYDLHELRGFSRACATKGAYQTRDVPSNTKELVGQVRFPPTIELLSTTSSWSSLCCAATSPGHAEDLKALHILDVLERVFPTVLRNMFYGLISLVIAAAMANKKTEAMFANAPDDLKALLPDLTQGISFVTTVLSDMLEDMADALMESRKKYSLSALEDAILNNGSGIPSKAWTIWKSIMDQFGHRGVSELDFSAPRYREDPKMLLEQVLSFTELAPNMRPRGLHATAVQKREAAVAKLSAWLESTGGSVAAFQEQVKFYCAGFGYRESGKYLVIKLVDLTRREVLLQAEQLVSAGRLGKKDDVWSLTLEDLRRVHRDATVDVRALLAERTAYWNRTAHIKSWPKVLTSRGRELRPKPRPAKDGEIPGHAVSPGKVRGRVKVLREPREKPLNTGEILVAKATDPGWTPLFVPAAGVLLEVGGALQHGALVAREFGKPCVAGIEDIMDKFRDGMLVEVDGTEGIVTVIEGKL
eukprot:TRINITY_DN26802_c0_g2_i1.p1 TRINITY_DN26802_c0_g2~~TRINITY_DN26802_c0_g2_i1.p1  ORF type:complete len:969 (+),score=193.53 TRINITY_DN26802_c0_g2_i1:54-2960(+)